MSIQITVIDPANTPRAELQLVVALLNRFITGEVAPAIPVGTIAAEDSPAAGSHAPSAEAAFNAGAPLAPENAGFGAGTLSEQAAAVFTSTAAPNPPGAVVPMSPVSGQASASIPGVPAAPAMQAGTPANVGGVDLDAKGLPWDARIHAKSGNGGGVKNADGTWRAKRGVDAAFVAQVEAELRAVQGAAPAPLAVAGSPVAAIPAPSVATPAPAPVAPANLGNVPVPPAPGPQSSIASPSVPVGATPQNATSVGATTDNYVVLVQQVGALTAAGKLTPAEVDAACASVGVINLSLLATRLDLVANVSAAINSIVASKG